MTNFFIYVYYILSLPLIKYINDKGTGMFTLCGREEGRIIVETTPFQSSRRGIPKCASSRNLDVGRTSTESPSPFNKKVVCIADTIKRCLQYTRQPIKPKEQETKFKHQAGMPSGKRGSNLRIDMDEE